MYLRTGPVGLSAPSDLEIEAPQIKALLAEGALLLDVREPGELRGGHAEGALLVPMQQVPGRLAEIPKDRPVIVYCAAGGRSFGVAGFLREQGVPRS